MEFVPNLFLDALYEVILVRTAKELPVAYNAEQSLPAWLYEQHVHGPECSEMMSNVPRPYAELVGRWGRKFENCCEHYRFVSMAIYLPGADTDYEECYGAYRDYTLFSKHNTHYCYGTDQFEPLDPQIKHYLLDLYFIEATPMQDEYFKLTDFTDPASKSVVYGVLDGLFFTANPLVCYKNLDSAVPFLPELRSRIRHRQTDTEVLNSPYVLSILPQNQPTNVRKHGTTLSVAIASLDDVFRALEIDSFSEFRFRKAANNRFSCESFVERVKSSLEKRSSKEAISIVIEDPSLASDLLGIGVTSAKVSDNVFVRIESPKVRNLQKLKDSPF